MDTIHISNCPLCGNFPTQFIAGEDGLTKHQPVPLTPTKRVLQEVNDERNIQDLKWGPQDHPSVDPILLNRKGSCSPQRMAQEYELPTEERAKFMCQEAFRKKEGTFAHVAVEELCEVIACLGDEEAMRQELVQTAAVCVAWIEAIDRRAKLAVPADA